jgi:hypothetical protein
VVATENAEEDEEIQIDLDKASGSGSSELLREDNLDGVDRKDWANRT